MSMDETAYWTTTQLAEAAGVDQSRIRQLLLNDKIKATKFGPVWMIPDEEAQRWLSSRKPRRKTE